MVAERLNEELFFPDLACLWVVLFLSSPQVFFELSTQIVFAVYAAFSSHHVATRPDLVSRFRAA